LFYQLITFVLTADIKVLSANNMMFSADIMLLSADNTNIIRR
jgi:hypothetical protein